MSNQVHKDKLSILFTELLKEIDSLPLHPKNKLLLYSRFVMKVGIAKETWRIGESEEHEGTKMAV